MCVAKRRHAEQKEKKKKRGEKMREIHDRRRSRYPGKTDGMRRTPHLLGERTIKRVKRNGGRY